MQDFSSKFFFVHTWDDTAMVQNVLKEVEHELNVKLTSDINATQSFVLTDEVYKKIEDAEFVIVFISKSSATCEYFAGCVTRSLHLNKSILPLEIEKLGLFNNSMKEFNFRKKPYSFVDNDSKAMFFAQLKATLGFNVESGDSFGALIHIVVDRDARIMRYGEVLGVARAGEDCKIRLTKGSHLLDIVDIERPDLKYSPTCKVKSNDEEQFLNIPLTEILEQQQHEAEMERRRLETLRQCEMEQAVKQTREEFERKQRELERESVVDENEEIRTVKTRFIISAVLASCFSVGGIYVAIPLAIYFYSKQKKEILNNTVRNRYWLKRYNKVCVILFIINVIIYTVLFLVR